MSNNTRPLLILALLEQLHAIHPHAMRAHDLCTGVKRMGHPRETPESVASVLVDMEGMGLVQGRPDTLDAAVTLYVRTEAGRVELARHGHA